jgi:hypothetical protein
MVSPQFASAPHGPQKRPAAIRKDRRFDLLRSFFRRFDCPAIQYAEDFIAAADLYDLDWRLLPSLSMVESSGGKAARYNNIFGWDSGRAQFSSPAAAVHAVGYRLAYSTLYRDKDLDGVLTTYNPSVEYAQKVKSIMRLIAPE